MKTTFMLILGLAVLTLAGVARAEVRRISDGRASCATGSNHWAGKINLYVEGASNDFVQYYLTPSEGSIIHVTDLEKVSDSGGVVYRKGSDSVTFSDDIVTVAHGETTCKVRP